MLNVRPTDATWGNAIYVARHLVPGAGVPTLQVLRVEGEQCLPEMRLGEYAQMSRLQVGALGVPAAIFLGCAIAHSKCVVRFTDGLTTRSLEGLRGSANVQLPSGTTDADAAVLLGAISLNPFLFYLEKITVTDQMLAAACEKAFRAAAVHKTSHKDALKRNPDALLHMGDAVRSDCEMVFAAVNTDWKALRHALPNRMSPEARHMLILAAISINGRALQFAPAELQRDVGIVLTAIKCNPPPWRTDGQLPRLSVTRTY